MRIGIDAHSLEGIRTGARGRYLLNLVREWSEMDTGDAEFILYFQAKIPNETFLANHKFTKKILHAPFGIQSFTLYYNFLLPYVAFRDKIDLCFFPFYMLPYTYRQRNAAVAIHDVVFEAHPEWFSFRHYWPLHLLARNASRNARIILTISQFTKEELIKYYRTAPEKIKVVYLGSDKILQKNVGADEIMRVKSKYGIQNRYIFFVGSIFNRRHIPECIEAFAKISLDLPEYQFFISGRNLTVPRIDIDGLIAEANNHAGREIVKRIDYIDDADLRPMYQGADAIIYLSDYEGFGLPVIEGMSMGKPVITSRCEAIQEVVGDYDAMVRNNTNSEEIYSLLKRILGDDAFHTHLVQKGFEIASRYSWQKTAKETLDVFTSL